MLGRFIYIECPACNKKTKFNDLLPSAKKQNWWELIKKGKVCPWCKVEMIMDADSVVRLNFTLLFLVFVAVVSFTLDYFDVKKFIVDIDYIFIVAVFICIGYFQFTIYTAKYKLNNKDDKA